MHSNDHNVDTNRFNLALLKNALDGGSSSSHDAVAPMKMEENAQNFAYKSCLVCGIALSPKAPAQIERGYCGDHLHRWRNARVTAVANMHPENAQADAMIEEAQRRRVIQGIVVAGKMKVLRKVQRLDQFAEREEERQKKLQEAQHAVNNSRGMRFYNNQLPIIAQQQQQYEQCLAMLDQQDRALAKRQKTH